MPTRVSAQYSNTDGRRGICTSCDGVFAGTPQPQSTTVTFSTVTFYYGRILLRFSSPLGLCVPPSSSRVPDDQSSREAAFISSSSSSAVLRRPPSAAVLRRFRRRVPTAHVDAAYDAWPRPRSPLPPSLSPPPLCPPRPLPLRPPASSSSSVAVLRRPPPSSAAVAYRQHTWTYASTITAHVSPPHQSIKHPFSKPCDDVIYVNEPVRRDGACARPTGQSAL